MASKPTTALDIATAKAEAADKPAQTKEVPGLRVTTGVNTRIPCAGHFWAGISEVPARDYTDAQIVELRASKLLQVEDCTVLVPDEG